MLRLKKKKRQFCTVLWSCTSFSHLQKIKGRKCTFYMERVDCMFENFVTPSLTPPNNKVLFSPTVQFMPLRSFHCVCRSSDASGILHVSNNSVFHFVNAW